MAQDIAPAITTDITDTDSAERRWQLKPALLLLPSVLITLLFLFYPLAFIVLISFTEKDSFLSLAGLTYTLKNYADMVGRYAPNVGVTIELAGLATLVDLILGFPFAYILVRKVRYRDIVRGFMVFPMFGALYIAFGLRFILLPGGWLSPVLDLLGLQGTQLLYGLPSVVFAMAIFTFPFMVMNVGAFAEPLLLGTLNEQRTLAWTLYQRGVVQLDYGLSTTMGVILMILAFTVNYASLRYSRGALVQ